MSSQKAKAHSQKSYNRLKDIPNHVNTYIDGIAGSVAAVMAMAGDKIYISEAGSIMIHNALSMAGGNAQTLEKQIEQLKEIDKIQIRIFQKRTGLSQKKIKELLEAETILMAPDAVKLGFANEIVKPIKAVAQINLNDMDIKEKLKGLASIVFGESPENEDLKTLKTEIEAKSQTEIDAKIQKVEGKDTLFAEYVPNAEFVNFKNQVLEFVGAVVEHIEQQPTGDEIMDKIQSTTSEELLKLLAQVKSKNKVPTPQEHRQVILEASTDFDLQKAKKYHEQNKNIN